jgi:hypothetical protein
MDLKSNILKNEGSIEEFFHLEETIGEYKYFNSQRRIISRKKRNQKV